MKKEDKTKPSLARKIATFVACMGLGISAFVIFLRRFEIIINHGDKVSYLLFTLIIIGVPCSIIATYLVIKEEKYWTNDPSVMSPLRKFGKRMILPNIILLGILIFSQVSAGLIIGSLLSGILFLGMWKSKFSDKPFNYIGLSSYHSSFDSHNSSSIMNKHTTRPIGHDWSSATGSNLINSPTFSSFNGNIYNR